MLAPNAQVSMYPWKDTPEKIPLAVRHIRTFLKANRPADGGDGAAGGGGLKAGPLADRGPPRPARVLISRPQAQREVYVPREWPIQADSFRQSPNDRPNRPYRLLQVTCDA